MPFKVHLALDFMSGLLSLGAPWMFGFADNKRARNTFLLMGLAGLVASALSQPEEMD